jgi:ABC-type Fe3+/spermidine/putrescine transport system ATPase subunit
VSPKGLPAVAGEREPFLRLEALTKRFGELAAVSDLTLDLARGEILALLGPSGSGKTTTLRLLAGFEAPDAGRILVEGQDVGRLAPVSRRFGMVFQHYALFPHLDVGENVAFGLESLGVKGAELGRRVEESLALVDLAGYQRRRVTELSGGQQQRVALARALAPEPRVLLLDEPLSNLDPTLRERTRREIRSLVRRLDITTIIVTHEQEEAFDLGDRIAVIRQGRLAQVGTPDELYQSPADAFVAGFVGRACRRAGEVVCGGAHRCVIRVEGAEWAVDAPAPAPAGSTSLLLARPEALCFTAPSAGVLTGQVTDRRFSGALAFFTVRTDGGAMVELAAAPGAAVAGDRIGLRPSGSGLHLFAGPQG